MAITQISKIQVRRGLQQEIGQLASGELAWAVDTQRLYIGNGTLVEGAPVIGLTQIYPWIGDTGGGGGGSELGNYIYNGLVQSGYTATFTAERTVQAKFDDIINVHDFGARGTGTGDDYDALQKCFNEVYNRNSGGSTAHRTRRSVHIPGGVYNISQQLKIPPYASIIGDGIHSSIINYIGTSANCIIRATTNLGLDPSDSSNLSYEYPKNLYIHGVSFQTAVNIDIFHIDSATQCKFEQVNFVGPVTTPNGSEPRNNCVAIGSISTATSDIIFRDCAFSKLSVAIKITADFGTDNIVIDNCSFTNLWKGVIPSAGLVAPYGIKITNSRFKNISRSAIEGGSGVSGISSVANTYHNVGNLLQPDGDGAAVAPVISFLADGNYSIADTFSRSITEDLRIPRIHSDYSYLSAGDTLNLGAAHSYPGKEMTVLNNVMRSFLLLVNQGIINYSVTRNELVRSGIIKFSVSAIPGKIVFDEEYTESQDLGVTISMTNTVNGVTLSVTTSNIGYDAKFVFDVKSLY